VVFVRVVPPGDRAFAEHRRGEELIVFVTARMTAFGNHASGEGERFQLG